MEQQNSLAHDIKSSADAKYDAVCKRLLAYKEFLARIMQRCVVEFKDCSIDDIINKYIEGEPHVAEIGVHPNTSNVKLITGMNSEDKSLNEGWVTYDIIFYALAPQDGYLIKLILNVEAQNDTNPGYPLTKRALYYCGRMLSAQYGREFVNAESLRRCIAFGFALMGLCISRIRLTFILLKRTASLANMLSL